MSSQALIALRNSLAESHTLISTIGPWTRTNGHAAQLNMATRKASTALLCSAFEVYLREVVDEAVDKLNSNNSPVRSLPPRMKLVYSRSPIDDLSDTAWERREQSLQQFCQHEGQLWLGGTLGNACSLDSARFYPGGKSPTYKVVRNLFRLFGDEDVLASVTKTRYNHFKTRIDGLASVRNGILHSGANNVPTKLDLQGYRTTIEQLTGRLDRRLLVLIKKIDSQITTW